MKPFMQTTPVELKIRSMGAQGDGVADHEGRQIFVPLALPGETVLADVSDGRARLKEILASSPERHPARCSHYGECGGCSFQHLRDDAYLTLKRDQVMTALSFSGISAPVEPVVAIAPQTRRRAVFAAHRSGPNAVIGFHARRSHKIVPISDCSVITQGIMKLLPQLRPLITIVASSKDALTVVITETQTGFDVALSGIPRALPADARVRAVQAAGDLKLARLAINGETVMELAAPVLQMGQASLVPPPGGFLQACAQAESVMVSLVKDAVGDARRIVDLFSGAGTFALPLASRATVHAVESDAAGLDALVSAARGASGLRPVTAEKRDLFRRPLTRDELKRFDAAVIDPPRAGAEAQTRELAASGIKSIAMVSCNPQTFARDLGILTAAGYHTGRITPVDQFLWSHHVEIVAHLSR